MGSLDTELLLKNLLAEETNRFAIGFEDPSMANDFDWIPSDSLAKCRTIIDSIRLVDPHPVTCVKSGNGSRKHPIHWTVLAAPTTIPRKPGRRVRALA
jgi:hypothetical protein